MKVRFTDSARFGGGRYVPANETNIAKTFARVKREIQAQAKVTAELKKNVKPFIQAVK